VALALKSEKADVFAVLELALDVDEVRLELEEDEPPGISVALQANKNRPARTILVDLYMGQCASCFPWNGKKRVLHRDIIILVMWHVVWGATYCGCGSDIEHCYPV
jgi:hypothetical protein